MDKASQKEGSIIHFDYAAVIQRIPQTHVLYESARLASHFFGIPYTHVFLYQGKPALVRAFTAGASSWLGISSSITGVLSLWQTCWPSFV